MDRFVLTDDQRVFDAVAGDPDMAFAMVDGMIVNVHRRSEDGMTGLAARPSTVKGGLPVMDAWAEERRR